MKRLTIVELQIRFIFDLLQQPACLSRQVSAKEEFMEHSPEDLSALWQDLQTELATLN